MLKEQITSALAGFTRVLLVSAGGGKPENLKKNAEQGANQQQTQLTYGTGPKSSPGYIGRKRALSPLHHPRSDNVC